MKDLNRFITERNEVDEFFKKQDEFVAKMIETWRSDERLKPFDLYFKWKSHEIDTSEWKETPKKDIMKMMNDARKLSDEEWEKKEPNNDLIQILDAIEMELINIIGIFK